MKKGLFLRSSPFRIGGVGDVVAVKFQQVGASQQESDAQNKGRDDGGHGPQGNFHSRHGCYWTRR